MLNIQHTQLPDAINHVIVNIQEVDSSILFPVEQKAIKNSILKRKNEFTTGRLIARELLAKYGLKTTPIPSGKNREPIWPPNFVGSISHCGCSCFVAVASDKEIFGLGVDIEPSSKLPSEIVDYICTKEEKRRIDSLYNQKSEISWNKLFFSAKESIYKCLFPSIISYLDFMDVEISIDLEKKTFKGRLLSVKAGKKTKELLESINGIFIINNGHFITISYIDQISI